MASLASFVGGDIIPQASESSESDESSSLSILEHNGGGLLPVLLSSESVESSSSSYLVVNSGGLLPISLSLSSEVSREGLSCELLLSSNSTA